MKKSQINYSQNRNFKTLARTSLTTILGGNVPSPVNCIVYSITTLDDGTERRYVSGTTNNASDAQAYASQHAQQTGGRYGYDCDSDGYQHQYYVS